MPITQSRVIAILEEAEAMEAAHAAMVKDLRATINFILKGDLASTYEIAGAIEATLLAHPAPTMRNVIAERSHFDRAAQRNVKSALRAARERRERGVPIAQTAPTRNPLAPAAHRSHLEPNPIDWTPPKDFVYPYAADIERAAREMDHQAAPAAPAPAAPHPSPLAQPETSTPEEAKEWITSGMGAME